MKTVSIVGIGRFGLVLYRLLKNDFEVVIYDNGKIDSKKRLLLKDARFTTSLNEIYTSNFTFLSIPISKFEQIIKMHCKYFNKGNVLIDVLSVKSYPKKIFTEYLKNTNIQVLLTHPMFGPDSCKDGINNLPIILDKFRTRSENYNYVKEYLLSKKLKVVEMSADKHDRLAAGSQGLTHYIGRLLEKVHFNETNIDSIGAKKLHEVVEQTTNDTWQLFTDLQVYNPYTKKMRIKIGKAHNFLFNKLLPVRVNPKYLIYGIQGGKGSFNEQAIREYTRSNKIFKFKIKYLYTSEKVLKWLYNGEIDYGMFAITNSQGGTVDESIHALAKYSVEIKSEFQILIRHFLLKRKDVKLSQINSIIAHPQVFVQCKNTLKNKYSKYKLISGEGDTIDTANAASQLANGKLAKTTAILGPMILSEMYNLEIIAENLQDTKNNFTKFLIVKRR